MRMVAGRIRKLEIRYGAAIELLRQAADPTSPQAIIGMLAAGDWQSAMNVLEGRALGAEQQLIQPRDPGRYRNLNIGFTDLSRLRKTIATALAELQPELRYKIARQLLLSDKADTVRGVSK